MILSYLPDRQANAFGVESCEGNASIYMRMRITKSANEFIDDGDISDGSNTFAGFDVEFD